MKREYQTQKIQYYIPIKDDSALVYQKLLKDLKIIQTMSRRGNCWDNAPQESFFGHMKDELHLKECIDFEKLKNEIDEYMGCYNKYRYQWTLNKMTPIKYRIYLLEGGKPLQNKIIKAESMVVQSASL